MKTCKRSSSKDLEDKFSKGDSPETELLNGVGLVVERYWRGYYIHSGIVVTDLRGRYRL